MSGGIDQQALADEIRRRAALVDDPEAQDLHHLAELIEGELHPHELARWMADVRVAFRNGSRPDHLSSDEPGFPPPPRSLREAALHGPAGELVKTIDPHTEADPAATLVQTLLAFGNACGRGPGFRVESDEHATNEFVAIVGETSRARKGTSWGHVRRVMRLVDSGWTDGCIGSGIASGEGLIHAVRDPVVIRRKAKNKEERKHAGADGRIGDEVDPGVADKRLLVVQGELAQVLRVMCREGNTVSPVMRDLWDHGNARGMSKQQPERTTNALVSVIGHITVRELRKELTKTEQANGFANRWLWVLARRSKRLPRGGSLDDAALKPLADEIGLALTMAKGLEMLEMTEEAWKVWELLYEELGDGGDDISSAITARAEAHVRRLSVLYALLDQVDVVDVEHLRAAIAVWDYCAASAAHIFGGRVGEPRTDKILAAIRETPGLSRTEIRSLVHGHVPVEEIERDLRFLLTRGLAHEQVVHTPGRPAETWYPGNRSEVPGASEQRGSASTFPPNAHALSSGSQGASAEQLGIRPDDDPLDPEQVREEGVEGS